MIRRRCDPPPSGFCHSSTSIVLCWQIPHAQAEIATFSDHRGASMVIGVSFYVAGRKQRLRGDVVRACRDTPGRPFDACMADMTYLPRRAAEGFWIEWAFLNLAFRS